MIRMMCIAFVISGFFSCQQHASEAIDRYTMLPEGMAGDVVKKAIERAGGWDNWTAKESFSFYKKFTYLDSLGQVERSVKQKHTYKLKDEFKARMEWAVGDDAFLIINDGVEAKKYKNGNELTDDKSKREAWNSSYGSHYVVGIPYKLTDPGVTLTYDGIDSTTLDQPAYSIKVEYAEGAGSSGGMHTWWYYFDVDNYDLAGFFLDYGGGHTLTTYEVFEQVANHRFHKKRFSYISNEKRERVMRRTIYENEEPEFNVPLSADKFKLL